MKWKPSCKTNSARWVYDGLCADPEVLGILLGLDGPVTWKMKKFTKENFESAVGHIEASVRLVFSCSGNSVNCTEAGKQIRHPPDQWGRQRALQFGFWRVQVQWRIWEGRLRSLHSPCCSG